VFRKLSLTVTAVAAALLLGVSAWGQAAQAQRNWKDRAEYDLYDAINKAQDANKKIELLNQWKAKYPQSDYADLRRASFIQAYQQANKGVDLYNFCKEVITADPKDMSCLYWVSLLTTSLNNTAAEAVDTGEKSAHSLLGNLDATFAPDKRPKEMTEEAAQKQKKALEAIGHTTLGWCAMSRKNWEAAEAEITKSLQAEPNNGQSSQWLGSAMIAQRKIEKQIPGLFHIARAVAYTGPGELAAPVKQQYDTYLTKVYTNFHGDTSGLAEIKELAKKQPFPPSDFVIKSKDELLNEKDAEFRKSNPVLAFWMVIKKELTTPEGEKYFAERLKDTQIPPNMPDVPKKLTGKLISMKPAANPKELVLGIADATTPEVTLKFEEALKGKAEPGLELSFSGVPSAFTREPFNLTFDVDKDELTGWPVQAAPAKKAAPVKKAPPAAPKKK